MSVVQPELGIRARDWLVHRMFAWLGWIVLCSPSNEVRLSIQGYIDDPQQLLRKRGGKVGDKIVRVDFLPENEEIAKQEKTFLDSEMFVALGDDQQYWPYVYSRVQESFPSTKVKLTYERGGEQKTAVLSNI